jgi:calmodulin
MHSISSIVVCIKAKQNNSYFIYFPYYILDGSGNISRPELKKVLQALHIHASENELTHLLSAMDTDHSGEINFDEFKKVMAASFFKKHAEQELHAAFNKFDEDGNGFITASELNHIMSRMGRHMSRSDIEAIIKSVDTTGNGKISFEDFCKLFD